MTCSLFFNFFFSFYSPSRVPFFPFCFGGFRLQGDLDDGGSYAGGAHDTVCANGAYNVSTPRDFGIVLALFGTTARAFHSPTLPHATVAM